ncbi:transporter substrate-binding domain-containing protein [Gemmobacter lanyuensis]
MADCGVGRACNRRRSAGPCRDRAQPEDRHADRSPPFSFLHEAGQLDGQRIALWQAMGERTGIRIIPHAVPTESALTALNDGRVDAVDLFAQSTAPGFGIRIMAPEEILRFVEFQRMKNGKLPAEDRLLRL